RVRAIRITLVAAIDAVQDHRQTAAEVRPNDLYVGALLDKPGESELRCCHRRFTRISDGKKGSRFVLRRIAGAGRMHEHHELAAAHLAPKVSELGRLQL